MAGDVSERPTWCTGAVGLYDPLRDAVGVGGAGGERTACALGGLRHGGSSVSP